MPLAAWILSLVAPFVIRAVIALGFVAVSFTGVTAASSALMSLAQTYWSGMPLAVLQLATLSGIPESLGMIAGAYGARVALWASINGVKYLLRT